MELESLIRAMQPEDKTNDLFELISDLVDEYLGTLDLFNRLDIPLPV